MKAKHRRNCERKTRYATKADADAMGSVWSQDAYQCKNCGHWHLTKQNDPSGRMPEARIRYIPQRGRRFNVA